MIYYVCENESKIARGLFLTADLVKTNILRALIGPPMYFTGDHRTLPWTYSYFIRSRLLFGTARTVQDMDFGDNYFLYRLSSQYPLFSLRRLEQP